MAVFKVVITGGPGTGKTSIIQELKKKGFFCRDEVIRRMTSEAKATDNGLDFAVNPIVSVPEPLAFNQGILDARIGQFKDTPKADGQVVFFDRGIPDVLAYMDCFGQSYGKDFENACRTYRYDQVFMVPPWADIYQRDEGRFERFSDVLRIDRHIRAVYGRYGYSFIELPRLPVGQRIDFILENLNDRTWKRN